MAKLSPGDDAPAFEAQSADGPVRLADHRGSWVVVYFYPADNTPGCTAEACSFRDSHEDFVEAGAVVIGVSGDSVESHQGFAAKHDLPFTLVSDDDGALAQAFGVGKTLGILPERVTFVIDPDGVVREVFRSQMRAKQHHVRALATIKGSLTS